MKSREIVWMSATNKRVKHFFTLKKSFRCNMSMEPNRYKKTLKSNALPLPLIKKEVFSEMHIIFLNIFKTERLTIFQFYAPSTITFMAQL
mmetsp:Transcript_9827/g.14649  ORF Transcript_9827/g.14649 Transcript_9827/m.14649 type:complete len:90 (-) Transcript_9827:58-327(-)